MGMYLLLALVYLLWIMVFDQQQQYQLEYFSVKCCLGGSTPLYSLLNVQFLCSSNHRNQYMPEINIANCLQVLILEIIK